jgi:hypothetical protein
LRLHNDEPAQHGALHRRYWRSQGAGSPAPGKKLLPGFTNRYNVSKLVYYEAGRDGSGAIAREKQIKAGSRRRKIELINRLNPEWRDLYEEL